MNWGIPGSTSWHRSPAPKSSHLLLVTHTVLPSQFINSFLTYPANRQTNIQMQKHNLLGGGKNDNFFSDPHSMPVKVKLPYSDRSVGGVLISLSKAVSPEVVIPLLSVTHGQCYARPTVTSQLGLVPNYTAWWQRYMREQLAQDCSRKRGGRESNSRPVDRKSSALTTTPRSHTACWHSYISL